MFYPYSCIPETVRAPRLQRLAALARASVPLVSGGMLDSSYLKEAAVRLRLVPDMLVRSFTERAEALKSYSLSVPNELKDFSSYSVYALHPLFVIPPIIAKSFSEAILQAWNVYLQHARKPVIPNFLVQEHLDNVKGHALPFHPATGNPEEIFVAYGSSAYLCARQFCILRKKEGCKRLTHNQLKNIAETVKKAEKSIGKLIGFTFSADEEIVVHEFYDASPSVQERHLPAYYNLISSPN